MGGAAAGVDVGAVRFVVQHLDAGAEGAQNPWRGCGGGAVRAVDHHTQPLQPAPLDRAEHRLGPPLHLLGAIDDGADGITGDRRTRDHLTRRWDQEGEQLRLEGRLHRVGELLAAGREELHAVVGERVVRRGDHRPGDAVGGREPRHGRRGGHAQRRDVHALGRQPGDERGLEQRARQPRVPSDDEAITAEHPSGRPPERQHHLGGEVEVRHPPHPVRPELQHPDRRCQTEAGEATRGTCEGGGAPLAQRRTASALASTAEPCGPS